MIRPLIRYAGSGGRSLDRFHADRLRTHSYYNPKKPYFASIFLLDKTGVSCSAQPQKPDNPLNNRIKSPGEKQKAPVYLPELYADWALPIHEYELTQHQSNNQLNLRVL